MVARRISLVLLMLFALVGVSLARPDGASAARPRLVAPRTVTVTLHEHSLTVAWTPVRNAASYEVTILPQGVSGVTPGLPLVKAPAHQLTVKFSKLPAYGYGGFNIWVKAGAHGKWGASSQQSVVVSKFQRPVQRYTYSTKTKSENKAVSVVKSCLKSGLTTAVGTGAVGAPFVMFGIAIPGVGEVTAGGLAAVAGVAGGGATVACFAGSVL